MLRTDHAHQFPGSRYHIHILSRSCTSHIRERRLALFGYAGHNGDTTDIVRIDSLLPRKIGLRHGSKHLLGRLGRGKISQISGISFGHKIHPSGTAGSKHGPRILAGIAQAIQQFAALFHDRKIRREVGVKYIVETDALQRCHHPALAGLLRSQSQLLPPCGTDGGSHLNHGNFLGIRQHIKYFGDIISLPKSSCRTMGDTLSAERTVGSVYLFIAGHVYRSAGARILYVPHMHILYLVADLYTAHTFDTFSGITDQGEGRIPGNLSHFLFKRNFQNSQIIGNLLQITVAASHTGSAMAVMLRQHQFHIGAAHPAHLRRIGIDHHSLLHRTVAGGDQLILALHFHHTDFAGAYLVDSFQKAEMGNLDTKFQRRFHNGRSLGNGNAKTIYCKIYHIAARPPFRLP